MGLRDGIGFERLLRASATQLIGVFSNFDCMDELDEVRDVLLRHAPAHNFARTQALLASSFRLHADDELSQVAFSIDHQRPHHPPASSSESHLTPMPLN